MLGKFMIAQRVGTVFALTAPHASNERNKLQNTDGHRD